MNRNLDLALFGMFFVLSLLTFLAGFAPQLRAGSRWIRLALLVVGPLGMTWAIFCACLRIYQHELSRSTYHMLHDLKIGVGGIAAGMFIVLLMSSEFVHSQRGKRPNMRPSKPLRASQPIKPIIPLPPLFDLRRRLHQLRRLVFREFMKPQNCFGIVVRTIGLLLTLAALAYLLFGLCLLCFGHPFLSDAGFLSFLSGVPAILAGLYLLRGAPALMSFCYPTTQSSR